MKSAAGLAMCVFHISWPFIEMTHVSAPGARQIKDRTGVKAIDYMDRCAAAGKPAFV